MSSYNNIDPFEKLVKSKLADYKAEVPLSSWEKLEDSLYATQKIKVIRKKWILSTMGAVAVALIGIFFVYQNINNELPMNVSEYQTKQTESIAIEKEIEKPTLNERVIKRKELSQSLVADNSSSLENKVSTSQLTQDVETSEASTTDQQDVVIQEYHNQRNDVDEETKQQLIQDFINEGKRTLSSADETIVDKTKKKGKNSISLSAQSGLTSSQETNTVPATLRSSLSDSYGTYAMSKMEANNVQKEIKPKSEMKHSQPVSFGILASFALSKRVQIETGLIYTYLTSETESKSIDYSESEKVQFHYIGVPLNLNYTVLSMNKLDMYVTAGAMIEKDISGRIKYYDDKNESSLSSGYTSNRSSMIKQHNPQFSILSGLGITYPIYNKAKLFGKIGGRYYLNANNEYKTYYSDEKFGLDVQMGIKFNF